jgi:hypothetical protein
MQYSRICALNESARPSVQALVTADIACQAPRSANYSPCRAASGSSCPITDYGLSGDGESSAGAARNRQFCMFAVSYWSWIVACRFAGLAAVIGREVESRRCLRCILPGSGERS